MYFTDTSELRRFEREMRQKPNFDKRNDDCDENNEAPFSDKQKLKTDRKRKKDVDFMTIKIRSPTQKTMQLNN